MPAHSGFAGSTVESSRSVSGILQHDACEEGCRTAERHAVRRFHRFATAEKLNQAMIVYYTASRTTP